MTDGGDSPSGAAPRRHRRRHSRLRRFVLGGSLMLLVLIGLGVWLGVTGYRAKAELTAAKDHVTLAKPHCCAPTAPPRTTR